MNAALDRVAAVSGQRVDPPTLMPSDIILELSGEVVRSRLCTFTDAAGRELCLRPDLTTPIARLVASGELPFARYHSSGPVYRLPPRGSDDPVEHLQVGFEWFGEVGSPGEDAEALAVALEAAHAAGARGVSVRFGDVSLYQAVLTALPLSPQWRDRLRRSFSRRKGPRELLTGAAGDGGVSALATEVASVSAAEAVAMVEAKLAAMGVQPVGSRGPEEIAKRLRDKASDVAPSATAAAALARYLDVEAPADMAHDVLRGYAASLEIDLAQALDLFGERLQRIAALSPPFWTGAVFSAEAGRRFEYYDGFVFELARPASQDRPVVSGGRYDGLIGRLSGGRRQASAIGAALRVDRLGGEGRP